MVPVRVLVPILMRWFPADTETLVVDQAPYKVEMKDDADSDSTAAMFHGYTWFVVGGMEDERYSQWLDGRNVRLAMLGARRFQDAPFQGGLGVVGFEGCSIHVFAEPLDWERSLPEPSERSHGLPLWKSLDRFMVLKGTRLKARVIHYLSFIDAKTMIACNNREFLLEMLGRRNSKPTDRALPDMLPEWKHVDRTAPQWAIRRSGTGGAGTTLQVTGPKGMVRARWLTTSLQDPWFDFHDHPSPRTRRVSGAAWEASSPVSSEKGIEFLIVVMGLLGFAVHL